MKKMLGIVLLSLSLCCVTGCKSDVMDETTRLEHYTAPTINTQKSEERADGVIVIGEKLFVAQMNDILCNLDDYLDKKIEYEGFYTTFEEYRDPDDNIPYYHYVGRKSPGCCGDDGFAGFQVEWDGEYPKENEWVRVLGEVKLETHSEGYQYLIFKIDEMEVLAVRGKEFVPN